MNERIAKLYEQAELLSHPEYENEELRNKRLYNEIFLPKFVKLIVQDCVAEAALVSISNYDNDDITWTCDLIIKNIKERFGLLDDQK